MEPGVYLMPQNPAHAGMNPPHERRIYLMDSKPRTRGDEPRRDVEAEREVYKTPHTRG